MAVRPSRCLAGLVTGAIVLTLTLGGAATAAPAPVGLGTATSFAVLAGTTVTNTGPSVVSGDLGVSPGTAVTGFPPGTVTDGTIHAADEVAAGAQADVTTAYNDAAGRSPSTAVTADLGGQRLVAGVYAGPTLGLTGTLTLDAQGDPDAVFVFQAGSTLITASSSVVALINGADPCNVFWQVGSSATLGTDSTFVGTVLALTSVTAQTGASVMGRLLARNAAVTLDSNPITRPACAPVVVPTGSPSPTGSASPTGSPSPTGSTSPTGSASPTGSPLPTGGPSPTATATATSTATAAVPRSDDSSTGTGRSTPTLPVTGTPLSSMFSTGVLAVLVGGVLLVGALRPVTGAHVALRRRGRHRRSPR